MIIINLTQHFATPEQKEAGVVDLPDKMRQRAIAAMTFDDLPTEADVVKAADELTAIAREACKAHDTHHVMIGGATYLMNSLHCILLVHDMTPLYAFSKRDSKDEEQEDGSVRKVTVFRHLGFVGQ